MQWGTLGKGTIFGFTMRACVLRAPAVLSPSSSPTFPPARCPPLCRNDSSVASLRAANDAAAKSLAARNAGAQKAVSTSLPDFSRLIPSTAARSEPGWCRDKCQHINVSSREAYARYKLSKIQYQKSVQSPLATWDPLDCGDEGIMRLLCEKNHISLAKALTEAGTPLTPKGLDETAESVREALQRGRHERVMKIVACMETAECLRPVCQDHYGNYALQRLLECTSKLRDQAYMMTREGTGAPSEEFASMPGGSVTAMTAFPKLMRALTALSAILAVDPHGVHVLNRAVALGGPEELFLLARNMVREFPDYGAGGCREGSLFMCPFVARLRAIALDATPASSTALEILTSLTTQYRHNYRVLQLHAKHIYLKNVVLGAIQVALPHTDAFRVCHQLAMSADYLTMHPAGVRTLTELCRMQPEDALCRTMLRDIACYLAVGLSERLGELAVDTEEGGAGLVLALLERLYHEREEKWVEWIVSGKLGAVIRVKAC